MRMKKIFTFMFAVVLTATPMLASAQENDHAMSVEDALSVIMQSQNVSQLQNLDCADVSDDQLEELGDAVMELMHPGQAHEQMDQMMGGKGSDSLRNMHIQMGRNYLGCYGSQSGNYGMGGMMGSYGMGMMGPGMMGSLRSGDYQNTGGQGNMMNGLSANKNWQSAGGGFMPMMGNFGIMSGFGGTMSTGWSVFGWLFSIILLVLVILGIAALIKYLKGDKK